MSLSNSTYLRFQESGNHDFDLNKDFPIDDVNQGEIVRKKEPITSSVVHVPCPFPFPMSSISEGFQKICKVRTSSLAVMCASHAGKWTSPMLCLAHAPHMIVAKAIPAGWGPEL
ncbi:hypothetical protein VNO77_08936 [Canavalia gladiata]|uniref:Uncharacterized protein n=1 Tax=Canavalia gladiata TaxID=3824 RepID=A0AAN9M8U4_CANGL